MSDFTYNDSMSFDTLRAYLSRAVTHEGLCNEDEALFYEDTRMLLGCGVKFAGRAAMFSWSGFSCMGQIDSHYAQAARRAEIIHSYDDEMILQAGVFEIIYKSAVECMPIPEWVFGAFGFEPEVRNFDWEAMLFSDGTGLDNRSFWNTDAAWPFIGSTETQMYFYYCIARYIDAGFEAVHLGQAVKMAGENQTYYACWDKVTALAREYAKTHARRGIVLFDCHTPITMGGMKVGGRLVCDFIGAGHVPDRRHL